MRDDRDVHESDRAEDLSLRLRQTLCGLLRGLSEKQIAAELCISQHTVHVYVKQLYVRFEVNARSELLALWISPAKPPKCAPPEQPHPTGREVELSRLKRERLVLSRRLAELDQRIAMVVDGREAGRRLGRSP